MNIRKLSKKNIAKENIKLYNRRVKRTTIEITLDTMVILYVTESQSQLPFLDQMFLDLTCLMLDTSYIYNFVFVYTNFLLLYQFSFFVTP